MEHNVKCRVIQAEDPRWVGWAKRKAASLDRLLSPNAGFKSKVFVPAPGVFVYLRRSIGGTWRIRITGAPAADRLWHPDTGQPLSIEGKFPQVVLQESQEPADWSKDFSTFAYWDGSQVVLHRKGQATQALAGMVRLPHDAATTHWRNTTATMSKDGKTVVVLPASPTASFVAALYRWNNDTSQFDLTQVPLPPGFVSKTGTIGAAVGVASNPLLGDPVPLGYFIKYDVDLGFSQSPTPTRYPSIGWMGTITWKVSVDPRHVDKIYVDVRAQTPMQVTQILRYSTTYGDGTFLQGFDQLFATEMREIWVYDISAGTWSQFYVHTSEAHNNEYVAYQRYDGDPFAITPVVNYGSPGSGSTFPGTLPYMTYSALVFGPDGPHVVQHDNRNQTYVPEVATAGVMGGLAPGHNVDYTYYVSDGSRTASANVNLDGMAWLNSINAIVVNPGAGDSPELFGLAAGFVVNHVGSARRGAVSSRLTTNGTVTTYWESSILATFTNGAGLYSKNADWRFTSTDAYLNGVKVNEVSGAGFTYNLTSVVSDLRVLATSGSPAVFGIKELKVDLNGVYSLSPVRTVKNIYVVSGTSRVFHPATIVPDEFVVG